MVCSCVEKTGYKVQTRPNDATLPPTQVPDKTHRSPAGIRRRNVARAVEVTEVLVRRFAIAGRELVGEGLCADPVDGAGEVVVGDGRVPGLDGPHGLTQLADGGRRVEDDLGAVEAVRQPVQRVVAAVADVDCNLPVFRL